MNKYQEALDNIKSLEVFPEENIYVSDYDEVNVLQELVDLTRNQFKNYEVMNIKNEYGRALTIFQNHCLIDDDTKWASSKIMELINKETPKKMTETTSYSTTRACLCPICNKRWSMSNRKKYKYCPNCGQALDWGGEKK